MEPRGVCTAVIEAAKIILVWLVCDTASQMNSLASSSSPGVEADGMWIKVGDGKVLLVDMAMKYQVATVFAGQEKIT